MILKTVTISGADDKVAVKDLVKLHRRYPFVEWGILMSPKRHGETRYPSNKWLASISQSPLKKSAHLCGEYARSFVVKIEEPEAKKSSQIKNESNFQSYIKINKLIDRINHYDRVQLNLSKHLELIDANQMVRNMAYCAVLDFIIQLPLNSPPGFMTEINMCLDQLPMHNVYPFLDASGGKGLPGTWKYDFEWDGIKGFAGGITPSNVESVIMQIAEGSRPDDEVWIDLESGVRTDGEFDLKKVEQVLTTCAKFV